MERLQNRNLKTHQNRWGDTNLKERDPLLIRKTPCGKIFEKENNEKGEKHGKVQEEKV